MSSTVRLPLLLGCALAAWGCQGPPAPPTAYVTSTAAPAPRSIAVAGTADIRTAPDEFTITVGADAFAAEPDAAREASSKAMRAMLDVARAEKIEPKDICTEGMSLQVRYDSYEKHHISGYDAHNTLIVVLHDSERVERVLTELSKAGANRIDGVVYGSTRVVELRKEARLSAIAAARDKAQAMAAALGQKVGHPLRIDEDPQEPYRATSAYGMSNASVSNETHAAVGEAMATGKLRVAASVAVTFELLD
jgi:uncharacterized protein